MATVEKRKMVLIVEDDALLRMDAMVMIEEAGFDVLEAANADAAIAILETRSDIDVIFTDIDMPKGSINGLRLAHAVKGRWPPVKIIMTSGHLDIGDDDLPSGGQFIPKPYSFAEVTRTIHHLLGV
ncbi:response regulator [uncultured Bradyrhizobium sp.]|uniref:response regulator n=1 Tax=uncultured Bradyrhizobium sp. TaxID=199684 RepID=UPI0035CC2E20